MKLEPIPVPPEADESPRSGPRWTNRKMADFLRALAATHSVKAAAKAVGMSRQSAYRLRAKLKGLAFDAAWTEAFSHSYANLPYLALERAMHGVEVKHFFKGEVVGTSRRFDERLTVALLKMFNTGDTLCLAGMDPEPEATGQRLEILLSRIERDGDGAAAPPDPLASRHPFSRPDSPSDADILAEFRRFRRKRRK